jgi:hypothetical protein
VNIRYDTTAIREMNFSGRINRADTLAVVLKLIAQMNELEVTGGEKDFLIRKKLEE